MKETQENMKVIKEIMGRGHQLPPPTTFKDQYGLQITSPTEISNSFNDFFSDIGHNLASKIPNSHKRFKDYLKNSLPDSITLSSVTDDEVLTISRSLKHSHSSGYDQIDPKIAKSSIPLIAHVLVSIIICSITTGTVPDDTKIAKVSLYKNLMIDIKYPIIYQFYHTSQSILNVPFLPDSSKFFDIFSLFYHNLQFGFRPFFIPR